MVSLLQKLRTILILELPFVLHCTNKQLHTPDNVPTLPLLIIDYELIKQCNPEEINRLWQAATEFGFWYLKNHGVDFEVEEIFDMGAETMILPLQEKMKYEQGDDGQSFGYKAKGLNACDENGTPDMVEFINISKDDALAYPDVIHRMYPSTVNTRMRSTVIPFVEKSLKVNNDILRVFEQKLGLPSGALLERHASGQPSTSEARCIKSPPQQLGDSEVAGKDKVALGAHTDFGSLFFLHNRLGDLQVLPPGQEKWQYVRPLPGHAVCNVGDALTLFSGGILRSNLHRVVSPPGEQGRHTRWSLVFLTRPGDETKLNALGDESTAIREVLGKMTPDERAKYVPDVTARDWFARRIRNQRLGNRTGPETWRASRGMEHKLDAA